MPRQVTIVTPENIRIEYELAGLGSRAGAALFDVLLQGLGLAFIGIIFLVMHINTPTLALDWVTALLGIAVFIISWGYYVYFETVWNGQTPGKRYCRLRTIREGGLPIDISCAAIRNLVRVVDLLPVLTPYLIGAIFALFSNKNKRLGDFAAGTLVVKERSEWEGQLKPSQPDNQVQYAEAAHVRNTELITPEEFDTIKRFVEREAELQKDVKEQLASKIAKPIMNRLGIQEDNAIVHSHLLSEIHRKCVEERGMR